MLHPHLITTSSKAILRCGTGRAWVLEVERHIVPGEGQLQGQPLHGQLLAPARGDRKCDEANYNLHISSCCALGVQEHADHMVGAFARRISHVVTCRSNQDVMISSEA